MLVLIFTLSGVAWSAMGASVTLVDVVNLSNIYPGQITELKITLSNNATSAITGVAFSNSLPGTLPNGLKVAGAYTYTCYDPSGPSTNPGSGTLTAAVGTQAISLSNGVIPAHSGSNDGYCTIVVPVTAGTSTGNAVTYTYTIGDGAVIGNDGVAVANSGAVEQGINVLALSKPTISKSFGSSTLYLGGTATTLTITLNNSNSVPITGVSLNDHNFPTAGGTAIIEVATPPSATNTCGGTFSPSSGETSLSLSGATIPANSSCAISVQVSGKQTNGSYSVSGNNIILASDLDNDIHIPAFGNVSTGITVVSPLGVSKSFSPGSPASLAGGQSGSLTITLSNSGTSALAITSFTDSPIDGISDATSSTGLVVTSTANTCSGTASAVQVNGINQGVTLTGGTIPAGGSCTVTVNFTANTQAANTPYTYTNLITAGAVDVGNPAIVSQNTSATILVSDTLRVTKTNYSSSPRPGNPVQYSITVQNWSSLDMSNVLIQDTLPANITYLTGTINGTNYSPTLSGTGCSGLTTSNVLGNSALAFTVGTVPHRTGDSTPGACTVTFYGMVSATAPNGLSTVNSVSSVCTNNGGGICYEGDPAVSANSAVNTTMMSASKTFDGVTSKTKPEGVVSTLKITLSNYSVNALTNASISDTLPTSGSGQLRIANPANAATTCGGSYTITADPASTSIAMNGATVPGRNSSGGVVGAGTAGTCFLQVDVVGPAGVYNNTATTAGTVTYADNSTGTVSATSNTATLTYTSALSATKSFNPAAVSSGGTSTVTVHLSNTSAAALSGVSVIDPLPTGMVVAPTPHAYTTCAGSTSVTAVAGQGNGTGSVSMTGADIAGFGSCDFVFDVVATGSANWVNTIHAGEITANGNVSNQTAVVGTLNYNVPNNPTVAKATNPSTLTFPGQVSQLTITITNGTQAVTNLRLTDYFTSNGTSGGAANGMVIAATPAASTTCAGGIITAAPGGASVSLSGVALSAGAACTATVNVTSTAVGGITNYIPIGSIHTDQGLSNIGQASTSLTTNSNIGIGKQFTPNVVKPGQRSRLKITFYNPTALPMTSLAVTDNLPAGVTVPSGANPLTTCAGGTVSAPVADQVQLTGGTIGAASGGVAATCYAEIDVVVAAQGDYTNTIAAGAATALSGGSPVNNSQPASDILRAKSPLVVHKAIAGQTLDAGNPAPFTTGTATRTPGAAATMTIRLENPNAVNLTAAAFTDTLPTGLVVATVPNASTTCAGGTVTAVASGTSVRLSGATIPATGNCTVTVDLLSNISGSYTNSIASGGVTTFEGISNEEPTSAQIIVSNPPTVSKQFSPAVIPPNGTSTLTIVFGNSNASAITLSSLFTDTLPTAPGAIVVAAIPAKANSCGGGIGAVTAVAGAGTIALDNGTSIPAGGCTISVNVTGATPGVHNNNIPAGALQTNSGNNQQPANATLTVSTLGYVSGKVFKDNNVTPNGTFESGTDTSIQGVSIELHSGATCGGALVSSTTTDVLGNYLFSDLAAGTYSICESVQPSGTTNGITTAGGIIGSGGGTPGTASNPTSTSSQITSIVLGANAGQIDGSTNNNFAEVVPSTISGVVFKDENNNGVKDGVDTALAAVTIELQDNGGTVIATTTTAADGSYSFNNLAPGTYSVREPTQPGGTSNGKTVAGTVANGGTSGTATGVLVLPSSIATIILPPNTTASGNNFAEIPNGRRISGWLFLDYNNNGLLNNPPDHGIGGQTLNLTGVDINGNPVTATTTTATDGSYSFTGLPEGTYAVAQPNQPAGTTNGTTTVGSTGGAATAVGDVPSEISGISLVGVNTVSAENNFAEQPGAAPDLTITKSHSPANFASSSSTGYYTITPGNIGTVATSGLVAVVDTLPAGMTVAAVATGTGWSCSGAVGATVVTCTSSTSIGAGATGNPITLRVTVGAGFDGQILTNTAVISGGGEPAGFDGNNTAIDPTAIAGAASLSGTAWLDINHNRVLDGGEPRLPGWRVDLQLNGVLVATATTDANGAYSFTGLAPGTGYQVLFRHPTTGLVYGLAVPNETATAFTSGVVSVANPAGAVTTDGTLNSLTLNPGANIVQQSLPVDPSGVVYNSITRAPVAGATVAISGPGGFNPAIHLVGGAANQSQTTDATGFYQFLLLGGAPAGTYTLAVTPPASYMPGPSTIIPPTAGPFNPGAGPGNVAIQGQATAPSGAQTTTYYLTFTLSGASAGVVNNHLPIDPILGGAIFVTKTTPKVNVPRGDLVPYTIQARNTLSASIPNIDLIDELPPGFKYRSGSARLNGVAIEPQASGRVMRWPNLTFAPNETKTLTLVLVVGSGVGDGEYVNRAWALNNLVNSAVSNVATATVKVVPDPTFDCTDIIGKVFDDQNANGYQDGGEPGIPNIRVATAKGWLVTTDAEGRFHVPCAIVPQMDRGSNFIMKLDERTLPSGFRVTTENPRVVRATRGKMVKLNFGATIHRVVRVEVSAEAFEKDSVELKVEWKKRFEALPEQLRSRPSVVRLVFRQSVKDEAKAKERLKELTSLLRRKWEALDEEYPLSIEDELLEVAK
ncbi:MAG: hypothetical protein LWW87_01305 [Geobacteraceae bacterium]|nr:hypothetical protein [Geobacteraceae bacterium]